MAEIQIGDKVEIRGSTQDYILKDPTKVYTGEVISKDAGDLVVRLDEPVGQGLGAFRDVGVRLNRVRLTRQG